MRTKKYSKKCIWIKKTTCKEAGKPKFDPREKNNDSENQDILIVNCFQGQLQELLTAHNTVCTCWAVTFTLAEKKGQFHSDSGKS